ISWVFGLLARADTLVDPLAELHDRALSLRWSWEQVKDEQAVYLPQDVYREAPYYPSKEATEDAILEEAHEIAENHGDEAAAKFLKIAKGEGTPLKELIDTWLTEQA